MVYSGPSKGCKICRTRKIKVGSLIFYLPFPFLSSFLSISLSSIWDQPAAIDMMSFATLRFCVSVMKLGQPARNAAPAKDNVPATPKVLICSTATKPRQYDEKPGNGRMKHLLRKSPPLHQIRVAPEPRIRAQHTQHSTTNIRSACSPYHERRKPTLCSNMPFVPFSQTMS